MAYLSINNIREKYGFPYLANAGDIMYFNDNSKCIDEDKTCDYCNSTIKSRMVECRNCGAPI